MLVKTVSLTQGKEEKGGNDMTTTLTSSTSPSTQGVSKWSQLMRKTNKVSMPTTQINTCSSTDFYGKRMRQDTSFHILLF